MQPNEVLGVIGDNGAGKSTLIKVLIARHPDAGQRMDGQPVSFRLPIEARNAGIETVYQNLALSPHYPCGPSFWARAPQNGPLGGYLSARSLYMRREARDLIGGSDDHPEHQPVGRDLSGGSGKVSLWRAAFAGSRVIIMDEPTAAPAPGNRARCWS